uniref:Uncharacterized protein n=1 Tax=Anguilla anguilla TaxID=7936 RepID=A0A0E9PP97_ANGAN
MRVKKSDFVLLQCNSMSERHIFSGSHSTLIH